MDEDINAVELERWIERNKNVTNLKAVVHVAGLLTSIDNTSYWLTIQYVLPNDPAPLLLLVSFRYQTRMGQQIFTS